MEKIIVVYNDQIQLDKVTVEVAPGNHYQIIFSTKTSQTINGKISIRILDELGDPFSGIEMVFNYADESMRSQTDKDGTASIERRDWENCTVSFTNESVVREQLVDRWSRASNRDWYIPPLSDMPTTRFKVRSNHSLPSMVLDNGKPHLLVLQPRVDPVYASSYRKFNSSDRNW
jgi:hypothetical protein